MPAIGKLNHRSSYPAHRSRSIPIPETRPARAIRSFGTLSNAWQPDTRHPRRQCCSAARRSASTGWPDSRSVPEIGNCAAVPVALRVPKARAGATAEKRGVSATRLLQGCNSGPGLSGFSHPRASTWLRHAAEPAEGLGMQPSQAREGHEIATKFPSMPGTGPGMRGNVSRRLTLGCPGTGDL